MAIFFEMPVMAGNSEKESAAVSAAGEWLILVDEGKYDNRWEKAASLFKTAVKADQWSQTVKAGRTPLGKRLKREVKTVYYTTELPGAPDGEYVVIQFETSFENKKSAIETVTPGIIKHIQKENSDGHSPNNQHNHN